MTFYLGIHSPIWLERLTVPLFLSRQRLKDRKRLPRAVCDWVLDSGGFSELGKHGRWSISEATFVAEVRRYREEIGRLQWVPVMDWMCEPWMLERTGLSVPDHQQRTTSSYLRLRAAAPEVPWVPVLQGWHEEDYLRHWQHYAGHGVDLQVLPVVGLGSVCRRQDTMQAERIVRSLRPLRLHGFGFKVTGLSRCADVLCSADSMAWSKHARYRKPMLPECSHRHCSECERWAMKWRAQVLEAIRAGEARPQQLSLWSGF